MAKAILFINLGSPDSPAVADVRRYLDEFLTDPRVIDLPFVRKVIVPLIILNTRPRKSAEAYASIWTDEGSPLIVTSKQQRDLVAAQVETPILLAMRYGNPSIRSVLAKAVAEGYDDFFVVPMYPHYAMSSYETVVVEVEDALKAIAPEAMRTYLQPFYNDPQYLDALATAIRAQLPAQFDKLLFSFHGIPERHLKVTDPSHSHCLCAPDCCNAPNPAHATCYRHQCFYTAHATAQALGLSAAQYAISFQSRLGRDPWLTPYTDRTVEQLARAGVKTLRVVCPAFVTDCLETIEEIAEEAKEIFVDAGGTDFALIPCLNTHPLWIQFLVDRITAWVANPGSASALPIPR